MRGVCSECPSRHIVTAVHDLRTFCYSQRLATRQLHLSGHDSLTILLLLAVLAPVQRGHLARRVLRIERAELTRRRFLWARVRSYLRCCLAWASSDRVAK